MDSDDIVKALIEHGADIKYLKEDIGYMKQGLDKLNQKIDKIMGNDLKHIKSSIMEIKTYIKLQKDVKETTWTRIMQMMPVTMTIVSSAMAWFVYSMTKGL
jgi:2-hydroxy-3-keto-5-methylthiopentenyl-1-phosphate phosphatase